MEIETIENVSKDKKASNFNLGDSQVDIEGQSNSRSLKEVKLFFDHEMGGRSNSHYNERKPKSI